MAAYYQRTSCRMCDSPDVSLVMQLTATPPGNNLLTAEEIGQPEPVYPLDLYLCTKCSHVQLGHVVDPRILYQNNYSYVSGTSAHFVKHLEKYAQDIIARFNLIANTLVVDIGSNDGTCLKFFQDHGMQVLGVEPAAKIAAIAGDAGVETKNDFFSYKLAIELKNQYGAAGLITSHNACAHIDHLDDVVQGVAHWLAQDGIFVLEVGYLLDVYNNNWFDTIYHEHLDFHTIAPFKYLFSRFGLELIGVERIEPQGGSIRVLAQKQGGKFKCNNSVEELILFEKSTGLDQPNTFKNFGAKILIVKEKLANLLHTLKSQGKTIVGFGAPTKATTLLSHFNISADVLDFIVDDNPLKQGMHMPLSHIPIYNSQEIYNKMPDYILILAWNFAEPIMRMHSKYKENGGKFIVPMPEPVII